MLFIFKVVVHGLVVRLRFGLALQKLRDVLIIKLVEHIKTWFADVAKERGSTISDVKLDFTDIISGTGPAAFAAAMLEHMSAQVGHKVTWDTFHNIVESKLVGGILVLS